MERGPLLRAVRFVLRCIRNCTRLLTEPVRGLLCRGGSPEDRSLVVSQRSKPAFYVSGMVNPRLCRELQPSTKKSRTKLRHKFFESQRLEPHRIAEISCKPMGRT